MRFLLCDQNLLLLTPVVQPGPQPHFALLRQLPLPQKVLFLWHPSEAAQTSPLSLILHNHQPSRRVHFSLYYTPDTTFTEEPNTPYHSFVLSYLTISYLSPNPSLIWFHWSLRRFERFIWVWSRMSWNKCLTWSWILKRQRNPFSSKKPGWDAATLAILEGIRSLLAEDQSLPPSHPSHKANFYSPQGPRQKDKRGRK